MKSKLLVLATLFLVFSCTINGDGTVVITDIEGVAQKGLFTIEYYENNSERPSRIKTITIE